MIQFVLNGATLQFDGNMDMSLLKYLREIQHLTAAKDGCSGQATCGACLVEINGKAKLACTTKLAELQGANIITLEGVPDVVKETIAKAFVEKGAVHCGFCTPGLIMRTKLLFQQGKEISREEIIKAINPHLCRCTGYIKIADAIEYALQLLNTNQNTKNKTNNGNVGISLQKYEAFQTALGYRKFINDYYEPDMLHAALLFSEYPRAKVLKIDINEAEKIPGVIKVLTAKDVPGKRYVGLIFKDWPLMIAEGEITRYIGDVIAGVVATSLDVARKALTHIKVKYEPLKAITDVYEAIKETSETVHPDKSNILDQCIIMHGGNTKEILQNSKFIASGHYETQRIEHAFLETEAALAKPDGDGIHLLCNSQGIYVDRTQIASILNLPESKVRITLVSTGGGFGGKEDMTVQGHAALFCWVLKKPVKLVLTREESIRMHPKRHPVFMDIKIGCNKEGKLTAIELLAYGDTGAYASVGNKVMERVAGHANGGYFIPAINIKAYAVYTNNVPCGAMRGFGVNQVAFAIEGCIDELCKQGGFDRWQFRYDNALDEGLYTATGHVLGKGVGVKATLLAVKEAFYKAKYVGIACGIKNCGVGNGMPDFSDVKIEIIAKDKIVIHHGWTEMGQGVHTIAIQTFCTETGLSPDIVDVVVDTKEDLVTGMTTSSRATVLVGNAIIDACRQIKEDLQHLSLEQLVGKTYTGGYICDWTTKPGKQTDKIITHFAYGYATQLVILNEAGKIDTVYAAHDAGKIINPALFEGQIEGAVVMGIGYALSEELPMHDGYLKSLKLKDCGILRAKDVPKIVVIGVEETDPIGPYGAKGVGEIGLVPTAAAIANALWQYDGKKRYKLPMKD